MRKYYVVYTDKLIFFNLKSEIYTKSDVINLKYTMLIETSHSQITARTVK